MKSTYITNIQKYSVHDGEGIRTTIFFKGCPLSCLWCHNPETKKYPPELMHYADKCTLCMGCVNVCPQNACTFCEDTGHIHLHRRICTSCGKCAEICPNEAMRIAGREYTVDALVKLCESDRIFYEKSGGGVTLSGGEALAQDMGFITSLLKKLKQQGIHTAVDTCGNIPYSNIEKALPYTDTFLYDIKSIKSDKHQRCTGVGNQLILENLVRLSGDGGRIFIRIPVIGGFNDNGEEMHETAVFIKEHVAAERIYLLPFHTMGLEKNNYLSSGQEPPESFFPPDNQRMNRIRDIFTLAGLHNVYIGG